MRYLIILLFTTSLALGQNADSLQFEISKKNFLAEYQGLTPVNVSPEYMQTVQQVENVKILKKQYDFTNKFKTKLRSIKRYNLDDQQKLDYDLMELTVDKIATYTNLRARMFDVQLGNLNAPSNKKQAFDGEENEEDMDEERRKEEMRQQELEEEEMSNEELRERERMQQQREMEQRRKELNSKPEEETPTAVFEDTFKVKVELKPTGLWSTGNAEAWYQFYLDYYYGGQSLSPDKVRVFATSHIRMADRDLHNLQLEMGFADDSVAFYQHITSQQYYYKNATTLATEAQGRAELATAGATDLFGISLPTPKVKITDDLTEMKGGENTLYLTMGEAGFPKYELDRTVLEMVSGHYLLSQLPPVNSPFLNMVSTKAMEDGWAIYTSKIGERIGLYSENIDKVGKAMAQKERAVAARIDYGIHIEAWSKERALKFWNEQLPWNDNGEFMVSEIMQKPAYFTVGPWMAFEIGNKLMSSKIIWDVVLQPREYYNMVLSFGKLPAALLFDRVEREAKKKQGK